MSTIESQHDDEQQDEVQSVSSVGSTNSGVAAEFTMRQQARIAALEVKRKYAEKEAELERLRLEAEHKSRMLQLEKEAAEAQAELLVYGRYVSSAAEVASDFVVPNTDVPAQPVQLPPLTDVPVQQVQLPPPSPAVDSIRFGEALRLTQLPKLELLVFSGDAIEFQQWLVSFEKIIEDVTPDPARRLHYLMQYTSGSPKMLVSGHALNQTEEGYQAAKSELVKEFGNPYVLARAYLKKIESWKAIATNDSSSLKAFCALLKKCRGSMVSLKHLQQLNTDVYLQKIVNKLSAPLQSSWRKTVDRLEQSNKDVNFNELVDFIDQQARIAKHPVFSVIALQEAEGKMKQGSVDQNSQFSSSRATTSTKPKREAVFASVAAESDSTPSTQCASTAVVPLPAKQVIRSCPKCKESHDLDDCQVYMSLPIEDRRKFLVENRMCFGCYGHISTSHNVRSCRRRRRCQTCGKLHPTGLHGLRPVQSSQQEHSVQAPSDVTQVSETQPKVIGSCATDAANESVVMNIVMVKLALQNNPSVDITVYAALDSMSTACFISRDVWLKLGCPGESTEITIKTVTGETRQETNVVSGLCVSSVVSGKPIHLPKVYLQDELPINVNEIPSHGTLMKYPHLSHLLSEMPDRDENLPVGLIIGVNCPKALQPQTVVPSVDGSPFAVKTALGWCLSGPLEENLNLSTVSCNRIHASENRISVSDTGVKDMMLQMYESDFNESLSVVPHRVDTSASCVSLDHSARAVSQEDKKFLALMESEAKLVDGHYQLPLPFRQPGMVMPNNRHQAVRRAEVLRKRFAADQKFHDDYKSFMNGVINKGYARKIPDENLDSQSTENRSWYIPHHGVYHSQKPEKIRVVFDCSCQYLGSSLNKTLLQGPDLTNSLVGVLIRFRQESVAIMADIEAMFYQVRVPETQLDYLRFVWWPDGDVNASLEDYQMTVHLFGAVSSPSCANFALHKTAFDNESKFDTLTAEILRRNFYVDDMLKSVGDVPTAVTLAHRVQQMCANGGFHLTKFVSNSREVLETIPVSDRAKNSQNVDLSRSALPVERALGVHWCVENDTLEFRIVLKDKPLTRRGMLSTISSIYDPLGLVAPFLLKGKKLLQQLCSNQLDWDQQIEGEERSVWERWRASLLSLENIQIPRCFKPPDFNPVSAELHYFSDASLTGYGQCSYLRLINAHGQIHCALVIGKSRVTPSKPVTIPRLELTAATVSVKIGRMLEAEMQSERLKITSTYWTDSKAVLGYITNEARRFHTFVANRVQLIRDSSNTSAWKYIESEENPADDASRGLNCDSVSSNHRWFTGPSFLWKTNDHWPSQTTLEPVAKCDPEVKKQVILCATQTVAGSSESVDRLLSYHSSWYKLKKCVAWILVVIKQLHYRVRGMQMRDMTQKLTVEELQRAELAVLKYLQRQTFAKEISAIKAQGSVNKSSSICRLSPIMTDCELLCIGGRLENSDLSAVSKHPIILPSKHHVTSLIIEHFHQQAGHAGKEFVLSLIRERYWIISGRQAVRQVLRKCFTCRKLYGHPAVQKMADLPRQRVTPDQPPFSYVGLDFFGPFYVRIGRSDVKRYGCIFTCLTVRAVHIEVAYSLEADSFINALQRFIARRGQPLEVISDNGTNFVGGCRELCEAVRAWNNSKTQEFLRQEEIQWRFNPPAASHMGGVWERQIRTIRKLLSALMNQQRLTDEVLQTFLCIVENIINNRPLTVVSDDPADLEPLTPNHILQLRRGPSVPPGEFVKKDLYCRRRWRQVQYLADVFWTRWTKEYLPTLQLRSKWLHSQDNIKVNSAVLVVDDSLPRNCWLMGRVVRVFPGSDGRVRTVEVKTRGGVFVRPIHKLCLLEEYDD